MYFYFLESSKVIYFWQHCWLGWLVTYRDKCAAPEIELVYSGTLTHTCLLTYLSHTHTGDVFITRIKVDRAYVCRAREAHNESQLEHVLYTVSQQWTTNLWPEHNLIYLFICVVWHKFELLISLRGAASRLRCARKYCVDWDITAFLAVKGFRKSVKIWCSYHHELAVRILRQGV